MGITLEAIYEAGVLKPLTRCLSCQNIRAITLELLARGADLSAQYRLLTNDALTLAVMEKLGVAALATNDDDFDAVEGITVYKPTRT